MHDFNGHEVNGIHGLNGKKCYDKALYSVNNRHDFKGMHDFKENFTYDDFFRKTHARLYITNIMNITNIKSFVAALFSVKHMNSVNLMSVNVMHDCICSGSV